MTIKQLEALKALKKVSLFERWEQTQVVYKKYG